MLDSPVRQPGYPFWVRGFAPPPPGGFARSQSSLGVGTKADTLYATASANKAFNVLDSSTNSPRSTPGWSVYKSVPGT